MHTRNPCTGLDAGARKSIAADAPSLSKSSPEPQREPYRVVLIRGLWRGVDVQVEPATASHPLRHCRDHAEALRCAEEIAGIEGWSIEDRVGGD